MYLLRRYFQISAHEAEHRMPRWERDMLIEQLLKHMGEEEESVPDDPYSERG